MRFKILFLLSLIISPLFLRGQSGSSKAQDSSAIRKPVKDSVTAPPVATADTVKKKKEPKPPYVHQFRIGFDLSRIAFNLADPNRQGYEIQADYLLRKSNYLVLETGFGKGKIDYDNLKYDNSGYFIKAGIDKSFLDIISTRDFDIGFIGARYGMGVGKRSEASYSISSPFGSSTNGTIPAQNFIVHWGEITGGIKVELWEGVFAGWNGRMRFMLNSGVFKEIAPNYIPGYGKGDKTTSFDFNFYLSYAIRWGGK